MDDEIVPDERHRREPLKGVTVAVARAGRALPHSRAWPQITGCTSTRAQQEHKRRNVSGAVDKLAPQPQDDQPNQTDTPTDTTALESAKPPTESVH